MWKRLETSAVDYFTSVLKLILVALLLKFREQKNHREPYLVSREAVLPVAYCV
jgi:hypothetical protein